MKGFINVTSASDHQKVLICASAICYIKDSIVSTTISLKNGEQISVKEAYLTVTRLLEEASCDK